MRFEGVVDRTSDFIGGTIQLRGHRGAIIVSGTVSNIELVMLFGDFGLNVSFVDHEGDEVEHRIIPDRTHRLKLHRRGRVRFDDRRRRSEYIVLLPSSRIRPS